jgi:hypothetical protein
MTLRERFDSLERKLDQLLALAQAGARSRPLDQIADSLDQADASLRESQVLLDQIQERHRERERGQEEERAVRSAEERAEVFDRLLNPRPIRLLVEENGGKLWRAVEGKCLLGSAGIDGDLTLGRWAKAAGGNGRDSMVDWFVIQTKGRKFVIYKRPADSAVGRSRFAGIWPGWRRRCRSISSRKPALKRTGASGARARLSELPLEGV